eukprot:SAG11_NODE_921_length_6541_cov_9.172462_3_plen_157_part_00
MRYLLILMICGSIRNRNRIAESRSRTVKGKGQRVKVIVLTHPFTFRSARCAFSFSTSASIESATSRARCACSSAMAAARHCSHDIFMHIRVQDSQCLALPMGQINSSACLFQTSERANSDCASERANSDCASKSHRGISIAAMITGSQGGIAPFGG